MNKKLELKSIMSIDLESKGETLETWNPESTEDICICLDMEIGFQGEDGADIFYAMLLNYESLNNHKTNEIDKSKTIIISDYSFAQVNKKVEEILAECSKNTWQECCDELQKYFNWEYEGYKP